MFCQAFQKPSAIVTECDCDVLVKCITRALLRNDDVVNRKNLAQGLMYA